MSASNDIGRATALAQIRSALAEVVERTKYRSSYHGEEHTSKDVAAALHGAHCLARWGAEEQMYQRGAKDIRELMSKPYAAVELAVRLLKALEAEFQGGGLVRIAANIRKAVTEDLLTQGEELGTAGYDRAALVVIGAALEQHLRRLAGGDARLKVDAIISQLQQASAVDKNEARQLRWAYGLRNSAAHGDPIPEAAGTTDLMAQTVRSFIGQHPA